MKTTNKIVISHKRVHSKQKKILQNNYSYEYVIIEKAFTHTHTLRTPTHTHTHIQHPYVHSKKGSKTTTLRAA